MEVPFVDLKAQYVRIKSEVDQAVAEVFAGGQFIGGHFVQKFESAFARLINSRNCIGVANGTDAIFVALKSLGVQPGDEVITPAFGWISSSEMITLAGGKPVFSDVLPNGTLDPAQLEQKITAQTKGIVLIHLYGQAAQASQIKSICDKHGLFLIEDCAQAHLTEENNAFAGTIGDFGAFSFYPTKNLGAYGDAGCVIANKASLEKNVRYFSNHGGLNEHLMEGINSRLDPLQAALLTVKIKHIAVWTMQRISNANLYFELIKNIEQLTLPEVRPGTVHTFHQFVIRTANRDALKEFLHSKGIQTMVHYSQALHNLPAYRYMHWKAQDFPQATECQNTVLSLPIYPELTREQIVYVATTVRAFFEQSK